MHPTKNLGAILDVQGYCTKLQKTEYPSLTQMLSQNDKTKITLQLSLWGSVSLMPKQDKGSMS
jgi:hypothetical protein